LINCKIIALTIKFNSLLIRTQRINMKSHSSAYMNDQRIIDGLSELINTVAGLQYETNLVFRPEEYQLRKKLCSENERLFIDAVAIHLLHFEENHEHLIHELRHMNEELGWKEPWLVDLLALEHSNDHLLFTNQNHWSHDYLISIRDLMKILDSLRLSEEKDDMHFAIANKSLSLFNSLDEKAKEDFSSLCILSLQAFVLSATHVSLTQNRSKIDTALEYILEQPTMGVGNLLFVLQVLVATKREEEAIQLLDTLLEHGIRPFTPEVPYAETISSLVKEWVDEKEDWTKKNFRKELPWFSSRSEEYWYGVQKILKGGSY
jgi:hypothetical protein